MCGINNPTAKLQGQRDFFQRGLTRSLVFRASALKSLRQAIIKHEHDILAALAHDMAKPSAEAFMSEISPVLHEIDFALKHLPKWQKSKCAFTPYYLLPGKSRLYREPFGVCLIIAPWNYPFSLCLQPLVSAIAAGNCAAVKPSRQTPATFKIIQELLAQTFSSEYIRVVEETEHATVLQERFDFVFFTGGTETARTVMQAAAINLTPVVLELGGKSPCIVDGSIVKMRTAARRIMWGKFFNAGQTCIAPDYVLVSKAKRAEIISHFKTALTQLFGGATPILGTHYARIINKAQWQKLNTLLEGAREQIIWGGHADEESLYIAPTLLDADWNSPLMEAEIFGPLLPVLTYDSLDELLARLAVRPKPLALYVFSENKAFQRAVTDKLSFGGACVNSTLMHFLSPNLPFGGVGMSGMGHYHGRYGFETFSHLKPVLSKPLWGDVRLPYPPYTARKLRWLRKLF